MNSKFGVSLKLRSNLGWLLWLILISLIILSPLLLHVHISHAKEAKSGDVSFTPNMIPQLTLTPRTGRNNESFRFEWLNNTFDLELFFNATYKNVTRLFSLKDFEDDFNVTVNYVTNRNESNIHFGWVIDNVENVSDFVDSAWFKIEDSSFDYDVIEVEEIDSFADFGYNITRFHLPDNLVLSFEDLNDKGFVIGSQNKTATSVKGFSGKSSWNLDPVTFSSPIITVTGFTEATPCTFWDLWNASSVNGWNVVHNNNNTDTQFEFDARIVLGDGSTATWFADTNVQVTFNSLAVSANSQILIDIKNNANFTIGNVLDATNKVVDNGVQFISLSSNSFLAFYKGQTGATANVYSSSFTATSNVRYIVLDKNGGRLWNALLDETGVGGSGMDMDVFNVIIVRPLNGIQFPKGTFDKISIYKTSYGIYFFGSIASATVTNAFLRVNVNSIRALNIVNDHYIIDGDLDSWDISWGTTGSGKVYRQNSFDLNVTDNTGTPIQNANVTVKHYRQSETQDFSILTGSNGSFATQTLTVGFFNRTGDDTIYDYNPYNITITAGGYATKSFNFTLDEKTDWQVTLETPTTPSVSTTTYMLQGILLFSPIMLAIALSRRNKAKR